MRRRVKYPPSAHAGGTLADRGLLTTDRSYGVLIVVVPVVPPDWKTLTRLKLKNVVVKYWATASPMVFCMMMMSLGLMRRRSRGSCSALFRLTRMVTCCLLGR